jgi:predicted nucleotidyltransferase
MGDTPGARLRVVAEQYAALLRTAFGDRLVSVVLHGPAARGEVPPGAALDVLIVAGDGRFGRRRLLEAADAAFAPLLEAERDHGLDVGLARTLRTPEDALQIIPAYLDMTEDAILLYDRDGFFARVLDGVRASLDRLGARRVREGSLFYWETITRPVDSAADERVEAELRARRAGANGDAMPPGVERERHDDTVPDHRESR